MSLSWGSSWPAVVSDGGEPRRYGIPCVGPAAEQPVTGQLVEQGRGHDVTSVVGSLLRGLRWMYRDPPKERTGPAPASRGPPSPRTFLITQAFATAMSRVDFGGGYVQEPVMWI